MPISKKFILLMAVLSVFSDLGFCEETNNDRSSDMFKRQDINCDVAVCGGGPSGVAAAVAAARSGANVWLIEKNEFLGGAATAAYVGPFMTFHAGERQVVKGIGQEIVDRLVAAGGSAGHMKDSIGHYSSITPFDQEKYKEVLFDLCDDAHVNLLLQSMIGQVDVDKENSITGIHAYNVSGEFNIKAKIYIDTTGNGDVGARAGAPFEIGEPGMRLQDLTLMMRMVNVNTEKIMAYWREHSDDVNKRNSECDWPLQRTYGFSGFAKLVALEKENNPDLPVKSVLFFCTTNPGEVILNMNSVRGVDGTDVFQRMKARKQVQKQVEIIADFMRRRIPGFENAYISATAPDIGVRETRRFIGEYILSAENIVSAQNYPDAIALGGSPIDIHAPTAKERPVFVKGTIFQIPYRCLIPKKISNLLVAGRCISTDRIANGAIRLQPICMATGQAAGVAAAICIKDKTYPRDVIVEKIRDGLRKQNAIVDLP